LPSVNNCKSCYQPPFLHNNQQRPQTTVFSSHCWWLYGWQYYC